MDFAGPGITTGLGALVAAARRTIGGRERHAELCDTPDRKLGTFL